MTKTAVGAPDPGSGAHMTVVWHIEEFLAMLHMPYWAVVEMRYDEAAAMDRLRFLRARSPDQQWRIKKVTTISTEEVLNA